MAQDGVQPSDRATADPEAAVITEMHRRNRMVHGAQLERVARIHPTRTAFRAGSETRSYAELDARSATLARALARYGVAPGDRVALVMRNRVEFAEAAYAVWRSGGILVPVNFRLTSTEIEFLLRDSGSAVVIADESAATQVDQACRNLPGVRIVAVGATALAEIPDCAAYETMIDGEGPGPVPDVAVSESDVMCLLYTSGTTGRPKGVMLTYLNWIMQSTARVLAQGIGQHEVWLQGYQMFHSGGVGGLVGSLFVAGECIVLQHGSSTADDIVRLLVEQRVQNCSMSPTQWTQVCSAPGIEKMDFALRRVGFGAEPATPELITRMTEIFKDLELSNLLGQTEMSTVTCTAVGDEARRHPGSVGRPLPFIEARIVDDAMLDVTEGEVGEIVYRGPTVMQGYWRNNQATEEAFRGGWFHSGDLVYRDGGGLIWVVDRKKDLIISGGENIYCREVEDALRGFPGIGEVVVFGIPHERWGEAPCAAIVLKPGASAPTVQMLREFSAPRLASYKRPAAVLIVSELPRNAAGKVQRFKLRESWKYR